MATLTKSTFELELADAPVAVKIPPNRCPYCGGEMVRRGDWLVCPKCYYQVQDDPNCCTRCGFHYENLLDGLCDTCELEDENRMYTTLRYGG